MKLTHQAWMIACTGYFLILIGIMLTADFGLLPYAFLEQIPYYDTIGHFILYGIASFLSHRATGRKMLIIFNYPVPFGPFLFVGFTIAEEILQMILPNRTFSFLDLTASLLGIILFYQWGEYQDQRNNS